MNAHSLTLKMATGLVAGALVVGTPAAAMAASSPTKQSTTAASGPAFIAARHAVEHALALRQDRLALLTKEATVAKTLSSSDRSKLEMRLGAETSGIDALPRVRGDVVPGASDHRYRHRDRGGEGHAEPRAISRSCHSACPDRREERRRGEDRLCGPCEPAQQRTEGLFGRRCRGACHIPGRVSRYSSIRARALCRVRRHLSPHAATSRRSSRHSDSDGTGGVAGIGVPVGLRARFAGPAIAPGHRRVLSIGGARRATAFRRRLRCSVVRPQGSAPAIRPQGSAPALRRRFRLGRHRCKCRTCGARALIGRVR